MPTSSSCFAAWRSCQDAAGSAAELAAQLPGLEELIAIESLDRAFGETSAPGLPVTEALIQLAGWATGVRLAYETLREMDPPWSP